MRIVRVIEVSVIVALLAVLVLAAPGVANAVTVRVSGTTYRGL